MAAVANCVVGGMRYHSVYLEMGDMKQMAIAAIGKKGQDEIEVLTTDGARYNPVYRKVSAAWLSGQHGSVGSMHVACCYISTQTRLAIGFWLLQLHQGLGAWRTTLL
jgi:hypothetical protein